MEGGELWHIVEARRDDGAPTMFRIRELEPKRDLQRIFVVEMPYPATELSRLPDASSYRRLADFDDQWLRPACLALGWELVGQKTEDGSFFLYMYGNGDPNELIARISPFDANLGFYDDTDPDWLEYGTLRELLDQAKAIPKAVPPEVTAPVPPTPVKRRPAAKAKPAAKLRPAAKRRPAAKAKPAAKAASAAKSKRAARPAARRAAKKRAR